MRKEIVFALILGLIVFGKARADFPKISNLQFSANPVPIGKWFNISVEFEGDVDRIFVENTWETKDGEIKRDVKEYPIPPDIKDKPKGVITRQWKVTSADHKPYRILKVWMTDSNGNQSNVLSGEIKVAIPEVRTSYNVRYDYKKLEGKWVWTYELGYAILTIKSVLSVDNELSISAIYENYNPTWGSNTIGKGSKLVGKIDLQKNPTKIVLVSKGREIELIWDGKKRLAGYARFSSWSGSVDFRREE